MVKDVHSRDIGGGVEEKSLSEKGVGLEILERESVEGVVRCIPPKVDDRSVDMVMADTTVVVGVLSKDICSVSCLVD